MAKSIGSSGGGAVRSAGATAVSTAVVSVVAALAAVLLARRFGRDIETDGFLAAYGVYLVLGLAAQALRIVVMPELARAATAGRLADEIWGYAAALVLLAVPAGALTIALAEPLGGAITGALPDDAARTATEALGWLVPAGGLQLLAALFASGLAARDNYGVAAVAYAAGAVAGLGLFVALADDHGLVALAWGLLLNGAISAGLPLAFLLRHIGGRPSAVRGLGSRVWSLAQGAALPLSLQALYVLALRLAADLGVGQVTSLSYAYLIASVLVAASAAALGLVSSVPLTRRGLDPHAAAAHIVHASWLSVVLVVSGAGVFALAGGRIAEMLLGPAYSGEAGEELGRLLVFLAPWMVVSVAISLTLPLLFVVGQRRVLVPLATALLPLQLAFGWLLREAFELPGLAISLALTTLLAVVVLMASLSLRLLGVVALALGRLSLLHAALAALSFGVLSLLLSGVPAALAGLALYAALLAALRPRGLREAWAYVRAL